MPYSFYSKKTVENVTKKAIENLQFLEEMGMVDYHEEYLDVIDNVIAELQKRKAACEDHLNSLEKENE